MQHIQQLFWRYVAFVGHVTYLQQIKVIHVATVGWPRFGYLFYLGITWKDADRDDLGNIIILTPLYYIINKPRCSYYLSFRKRCVRIFWFFREVEFIPNSRVSPELTSYLAGLALSFPLISSLLHSPQTQSVTIALPPNS